MIQWSEGHRITTETTVGPLTPILLIKPDVLDSFELTESTRTTVTPSSVTP